MTTKPGEHLSLADLGWNDSLASLVPPDTALRPARVASVYSARVGLWTPEGQTLASLRSRALRDAPVEGGIAVGDWVLVAPSGSSEVVVEHVLPRRTSFLRQAAGERAEPQAIAANVDVVLVVTSPEGDLNVRRLERYLVAIASGGAEARIVLSKIDLAPDSGELLARLSELAPVIATSARTGEGLDALRALVPAGVTAALVGSSGVGKSALVNQLLGRDVQHEGEVRAHDKRGRHTTTRRELFLVPGGGLLVDTPGMRELKPWRGDVAPMDDAFEDVAEVASRCRYRDCRHAGEPGCAVAAAAESGELEADRVAAWRKLGTELAEASPRQRAFAAHEEKRRARAMSVALEKRVREKRG